MPEDRTEAEAEVEAAKTLNSDDVEAHNIEEEEEDDAALMDVNIGCQ